MSLTGRDVGQLGGEWRSTRCVTEFDFGWFVLILHISQLVRDRRQIELEAEYQTNP
jgi:hypothetical protein